MEEARAGGRRQALAGDNVRASTTSTLLHVSFMPLESVPTASFTIKCHTKLLEHSQF